MNSIVEEIIEIEKKYLKIETTSWQSKNFYELISINLDFILKIIDVLQIHDKKKKTLENYYKYTSFFSELNIDYSSYKYIKSDKSYFFTIIALSIIWAFNETAEYSIENIKNKLPHDSYLIINETIIFLNNYRIWCLDCNKNNYLNIDKKEHNSIIFKIYAILIHNNVIKTETIFLNWLKRKQISYDSNFFKKKKIFKLYMNPFKLKKNKFSSVLISDHYSFSWDMYIPNSRSNALFTLKEDSIINSMLTMYTNIDFNLFQTFFQMYLNEHNLDENNLEKNYIKFNDEYKKAIRQSNKDLISNLGKKLSIYQKAIEFNNIIKFSFDNNTKFYLPWKYDFRGRTYFFSEISFTFNKEFRWCMYVGYYNSINDVCPKWHPYNNKIYEILDNSLENLKNLNIRLKNDNIFLKYALLNILICLGEIKKTELGIKVSINQFVKEGIKIFNEQNISKYDYDEKIKVKALYSTIKEFENDFNLGKNKKRLISKDAPASVFQHLILNFGWKDENLLKWCNLQSNDTWYDTYTYFINEWKKVNKPDNDFIKFFNRKSLKKVIMTLNYGVGYDSAEDYFKEIIIELNNKEKEEFEEFLKKNWIQLQILFKDFFIFISNWNLLKKSPLDIVEYIEKRKGIIKLSDSSIDANYYNKGNAYIIDFLNEGKRYTKYFEILTQDLDNNKFKISIRANYVQGLDSALARWIIKKNPVYTIHDCFLIDYINIVYLISLINEGMNIRFHDFHKTWEKEKIEVFSFFIVL